MSDTKNPYLKMPEDVLKQHISQIKEVAESEKMNVPQMFGVGVSEEDKGKLEKYDSLNSKVKELSEAAAAKDLSETESKLAEASVNRIVSDIKKIDPNAPLDSIISSKFNSLQKLDILNGVQGIVEDYVGRIATVKKEVSTGDTKTKQEFASPEDSVKSAASMAKEIIGIYNPTEKKE